MGKIILLRHGESEWNQQNRFTGWTDVTLTRRGEEEARHAARLIKQAGIQIDSACTSVLNRAIHSLWLIMETLNLLWLPVSKTWRLNERHYGALQGMRKDEAAQQMGEELVYHWRKSYRGIHNFSIAKPAITILLCQISQKVKVLRWHYEELYLTGSMSSLPASSAEKHYY